MRVSPVEMLVLKINDPRGIVNLRKFEHRTGNSPCRNSLNFQDSVDLLYAGMKPSLVQVANTIYHQDPEVGKIVFRAESIMANTPGCFRRRSAEIA